MSQLQRRLTLYGLTMVAVGSCIGAGIFATPGEIVATFPHAGWVIVLWVVGGLITLTGALTFAELGGMFPKAGGIYVYLKEAYGKLPAFLYGWVTLLVVNTGSLAALGLIFAKYLTFYIPLTEPEQIWVAITVIASLTSLNILGVNTSQWIISVFTTTKLLALLVVILLAGMLRDQTDHVHIWSLGENLPSDWVGLSLTALIGVLWSFGGWHHATYLAGETRHPQRNVPRAMLIGALVVTLTYVLTNLAYLWLLPLETIAGTERVAGDALEAVMSGGGKAVALLIGVSVFGTIAIYTMSAPRIYFAMARDGVFFGFLARLHSKFKTPANAMATQALWAIFLLLIWGHFHDLITYVTFIDVAFMTLAGIGIFIFRVQRADVNRPYRAWGYPVIPGLYVLITFAFLVNTFIEKPEQTKAGLAVLAAGVVVYFLIKHFRKDTSSEQGVR
ncbi:MAG: amino acid permease [Bacteroidota bacterium]